MTEACAWPVDYAACGRGPGAGCEAMENMTGELQAAFEQMAADYLWNATGQRFGVCDVVARPCQSGCEGAQAWTSTFWGRGPFPWQGRADGGSWVPLLIGGQWYNLGCPCVSACNCATEGPSALRLPGPVAEITSVTIDGVTIPPDEYAVMYGEVLVRNDGSPWPACQNLLAPASAPNTFAIEYKRGTPVPVGGQIAAGRLACEFALAAADSDECSLPERMQSFSRQGVTANFMLSGEKWQETGIWLIDSWVNSASQARSTSAVRSVDVPQRRSMIR